KKLLHDEFALILMDVQMPGLDGMQTARIIKERDRTRHVPIIFLTAISRDSTNIFRGYSAGAVDYLLKPFDPEILRQKVLVFIDLWLQRKELERREASIRERERAVLEQDLLDFKLTLDATADSVLIVRRNDLVLSYANQGALTQLGYAP